MKYCADDDERALLRSLRGRKARAEIRAAAAALEAGKPLAPEDQAMLAAIAREFARRIPLRGPGNPTLRKTVSPITLYVKREVYGEKWADIEAHYGINERTGRKMIKKLKDLKPPR